GDAPRHGVRRPLRDRTGVTPRGEGALRAARGSPQRPLVCTPGGPPGSCGGYVLICAVTCAENVVSRGEAPGEPAAAQPSPQEVIPARRPPISSGPPLSPWQVSTPPEEYPAHTMSLCT